MSKYNKLPGLPEGICDDISQKMPVSKLCCLPVLMDNSSYKNQINNLLAFEDLLPENQRKEIYQMLYMDELLNQLREYTPPQEKSEKRNPMDIFMEMQGNNSALKPISALIKYQSTGDISHLLGLMFPDNPMMSMLLPMMTMSGSKPGGLDALLPMLSGSMGNMDMLSSLLGNLG